MVDYTQINADTIDRWVQEGWEWGKPVTKEECARAREGIWNVVLTPTKPVPKAWFGEIQGSRLLGLAAGGGQQMPLFAIAGAQCTLMDYSPRQLESDRMVARREGLEIEIVRGDMTRRFPFPDASFDLIFHPVSNCYVEDVEHVWRECFRVLRPGGRLLAGLDNGVNFAYDNDETALTNKLPFNPLKDKALLEQCMRNDDGIQFSHTIGEQIGGQLRAGFVLRDVYDDTNGTGPLHDHGVPTFWATFAEKPGCV